VETLLDDIDQDPNHAVLDLAKRAILLRQLVCQTFLAPVMQSRLTPTSIFRGMIPGLQNSSDDGSSAAFTEQEQASDDSLSPAHVDLDRQEWILERGLSHETLTSSAPKYEVTSSRCTALSEASAGPMSTELREVPPEMVSACPRDSPTQMRDADFGRLASHAGDDGRLYVGVTEPLRAPECVPVDDGKSLQSLLQSLRTTRMAFKQKNNNNNVVDESLHANVMNESVLSRRDEDDAGEGGDDADEDSSDGQSLEFNERMQKIQSIHVPW
jgi:hypothetical protein